jgi:hypothetical protein
MNLGTVSQQPAERLSYSVDYADALTDGDNVQSATAAVSPVGLTVNNVSVIDPRVRFWVNGGTSGVTYKVTLTVVTADGRTFQDEITFKIKEL